MGDIPGWHIGYYTCDTCERRGLHKADNPCDCWECDSCGKRYEESEDECTNEECELNEESEN